jgi:hypothetical protein
VSRFIRTKQGEVNPAHVVRVEHFVRAKAEYVVLTLTDGSTCEAASFDWKRASETPSVFIPAAPGWFLRTFENRDAHEDAVPFPIIAWAMPTCEPVTPLGVGLHPTNYVLVAPDGSVHLPHRREWPNWEAFVTSVREGTLE